VALPPTSPQIPLARREAEALLREAVDTGRMDRGPAERLGNQLLRDRALLECTAEAAQEGKRLAFGDLVTVSPNVFIPLTNLCRNRCTYCTFVKHPNDPAAKTFGLDEVGATCAAARRAGCIEALFCLGDKPELSFRDYRAWLESQGYTTTADYLVEACRVAVEQGMLPHSNAGLLTQPQMEALRPWNASMGLMLETTSERLHQKGEAHFWAPDKKPELRLRMHREAGELKIPFTTGMLLGIGENIEERVDTLIAIRELADHYGHIQEAIIQPFHPKSDTKMRGAPSPEDDDVVAWVAMARLILGREIHVQAPPNLVEGSNPDRVSLLDRLLGAGVDDWGGVSPVTVDYINPEAPWPKLEVLRDRTEASGQELRQRLPLYPRHFAQPEFVDPTMRRAIAHIADEGGYVRARAGNRAEEAA